MRRLPVTLTLTSALLLGLAGCAGATSPSASQAPDDQAVVSEQACAAPTLSLSPDRAAPGADVEVSGDGYLVCEDTGQQVSEPDAVSAVDLYWVQGGETINLGEARVAQDGTLSGSFTVPADAEPGELEVMAGDGLHVSSEPAAFTVE
ncbi:hypothetical protein [Microbacterium sp. JZ31]|uniref:hypothetical protein n=1 Tax=Microbacterium sp. JZ31 TaxID=1906274 RepID=UPI00193453D4|nr:hypothetical protein [Microbacterium sp. JZ31]